MKIQFECECGEFCYRELKKNETWVVPKCRSCFKRMIEITVRD